MADEWHYVDLGHAEAFQDAVVQQEAVQKLKAKAAGLKASALEKGIIVQTSTPADPADLSAALAQFTAATQQSAAGISKLSATWQQQVLPHFHHLAEQLAQAFQVPVELIAQAHLGSQADYVLQPSAQPDSYDLIGPEPGTGYFTSSQPPTVGIAGYAEQQAVQTVQAHVDALTDQGVPPKPGIYQAGDVTLAGPLASFSLDKNGTVHVLSSPDPQAPAQGWIAHHTASGPAAKTDPGAGAAWVHDHTKPVGNAKKYGVEFTVDTGPLSADLVSLLYGAPPHVSTAQAAWLGVDPEDLTDQGDGPVPALFAEDDVPDKGAYQSSGLFCTAHNEHWDEHTGDPVACDSGGYVRAALPHEEKDWRRRRELGADQDPC